MIPILKKYQIHLILSSHDVTTQVIQVEELPSAVMMVVGASVTVDDDTINSENPNIGANLLWYNDSVSGLVLRLHYCLESIVWEIVNIGNDEIELTGVIGREM
jgi:hypothetical protein